MEKTLLWKIYIYVLEKREREGEGARLETYTSKP